MSKEVRAECLADAGWAYSEGIEQMKKAWGVGFVAEEGEGFSDADLQAIATLAVALYQERMRHVDVVSDAGHPRGKPLTYHPEPWLRHQ